MGLNLLTPEESRVIKHRGTESPFTGQFDNFFVPGTFICKQCNAPLFSAESKFDAECGWPAFDDNFLGSVKRIPESGNDHRTEIICAHCGGHLGHVFEGEKLTPKNTRHCVNSISLKFVPEGKKLPEVLS